ncbi:MAG: hypothetical protein DRH70_06200 [Candidatus Coatesbacteria bacterium]|nr:MAG: hypothetical protein DRH70_06200 [Candidatus Coatesbacteria bacterium]
MTKDNFSKEIRTATGLMVVTGIYLLSLFFYTSWKLLQYATFDKVGWQNFSVFLILNNRALVIPVLFILFAYFIRKRKKWAWIASVILLLSNIIFDVSLLLYSFSEILHSTVYNINTVSEFGFVGILSSISVLVSMLLSLIILRYLDFKLFLSTTILVVIISVSVISIGILVSHYHCIPKQEDKSQAEEFPKIEKSEDVVRISSVEESDIDYLIIPPAGEKIVTYENRGVVFYKKGTKLAIKGNNLGKVEFWAVPIGTGVNSYLLGEGIRITDEFGTRWESPEIDGEFSFVYAKKFDVTGRQVGITEFPSFEYFPQEKFDYYSPLLKEIFPGFFQFKSNLLSQIINKALPADYSRTESAYYIDDLDNDKKPEVIITALPEQKDNRKTAYLNVITIVNNNGDFRRLGSLEFNYKDKKYRDVPVIPYRLLPSDIDSDGLKEISLRYQAGNYSVIALFDLDLSEHRINLMKIRDEKGIIKPAIIEKTLDRKCYIIDIDKDGEGEFVEIHEKSLENNKIEQCKIMVYKWDGQLLSFNKHLSRETTKEKGYTCFHSIKVNYGIEVQY